MTCASMCDTRVQRVLTVSLMASVSSRAWDNELSQPVYDQLVKEFGDRFVPVSDIFFSFDSVTRSNYSTHDPAQVTPSVPTRPPTRHLSPNHNFIPSTCL